MFPFYRALYPHSDVRFSLQQSSFVKREDRPPAPLLTPGMPPDPSCGDLPVRGAGKPQHAAALTRVPSRCAPAPVQAVVPCPCGYTHAHP